MLITLCVFVFVRSRKQGLALYLLAVPFTLIADLKWWIIPTVVLVSFTLFGIEGIGAQIGKGVICSRNSPNAHC